MTKSRITLNIFLGIFLIFLLYYFTGGFSFGSSSTAFVMIYFFMALPFIIIGLLFFLIGGLAKDTKKENQINIESGQPKKFSIKRVVIVSAALTIVLIIALMFYLYSR